ncbi:MAG: (d)CMP kinase [Candidatus Ranarchaeia archaeon]
MSPQKKRRSSPGGRSSGLTIAICGLHGAGKSTYTKKLAEKLNLTHVTAGDIFRNLAKEHNMTLSEFSKYVESHPEIDEEIDSRTKVVAEKGNVILDGALTAWVARDFTDLSILLFAPLDVRVNRIAERDSQPYSQAYQETVDREQSERHRYETLYGFDISNWEVFDIMINTAKYSIDQTLEILLFAIEQYVEKKLPNQ